MKKGKITAVGGSVEVSKIVLGTCYFGTEISRDDSFKLMDTYYELGGRTIDTARVYACWLPNGESASEKTVGDWIRARGVRDEITLITKGSHPPLDNMHSNRLSEECIRSDFSKSLSALGVESIDVYFLHRDDKSVPVSGIMDTLDSLVKSGKVRALGASNWTGERIAEANSYAEKNGKTPFTVSEISWSYALSTPESWNDDTLVCMNDEEYKFYRESGIPVMAFSSQAKGIFSKYISGGEASLSDKVRHRFLNDENLRRIENVRRISEKSGLSPAAVALSFIICNPVDGFAIVGCSNCNQLIDSMTAADAEIKMSDFD